MESRAGAAHGWKTVLLVGLIVALMASLMALALWQEQLHYRERASVAAHNVVSLLERQLDATFDKGDVVLQTIVRQYGDQLAAGRVDARRLNAFLAYEQSLLPEATTLGILDTEGVARYGSGADGESPVNLADRDFFIHARDDPQAQLLVAGPYFARITQQWIVVLARRISAPDGSFAGVVHAGFATAALGQVLSAASLGPHGAATLRTADLALVHRHPDTRGAVGSTNVSQELRGIVAQHPRGGSYVAQTALDGIERVNAYLRLEHYPLLVIVGLATDDYLGAWARNSRMILLLGGLSVLAVVLSAVLVRRAWQRQQTLMHERERMAEDLARSLEERLCLNRELAERATQAEAASRAKGEFLANVSHEIRTPMNAVLGLVHLLDKAPLPDDARDLVRGIRAAGRTLLGSINDLLDYSKIEAGHLELRDRPFCLAEVLDDVASVMAASVGAKPLELIVEPPPPGVGGLQGDALRLEQVLINLVSNAIKFTERGHVQLQVALLAAEQGGLTLRFAVRDSGIGIAKEQQASIFEAYVQAGGSNTRRLGGTGLGLAISRRLVLAMGGDIGITSEPGSGSELWFTVRLAGRPDALPLRPEHPGVRLLVAEDHPLAREALQRTAAYLGWQACVVDSGEAAALELRKKRSAGEDFDAVLLDAEMPGMDGLAVARAIRYFDVPARRPIVLLVSPDKRGALRAHPESALADAVLTKPVTPSSLCAAVESVLGQRAGAPAIAPGPGALPLRGLHLLVVDDHDISRELALRLFTDQGARVTVAGDAAQALEWLRTHGAEVDLVLMDVQMPGMDGCEATRRIRDIEGLARLPVVALSAGARPAEQDQALAAGMCDFLVKPIDVEAAVELILRVTAAATSELP